MRKLAITLIPFLVLALLIGAIGCGEEEITSTPTTTSTPVLDSDGDGWTDAQEQSVGTNPYSVDSDGDGYWDPQDPNPLDSNIPIAATSTPSPIPTAMPTPTAEPDFRNVSFGMSVSEVKASETVLPRMETRIESPMLDYSNACTSIAGCDVLGLLYWFNTDEQLFGILCQFEITGSRLVDLGTYGAVKAWLTSKYGAASEVHDSNSAKTWWTSQWRDGSVSVTLNYDDRSGEDDITLGIENENYGSFW